MTQRVEGVRPISGRRRSGPRDRGCPGRVARQDERARARAEA